MKPAEDNKHGFKAIESDDEVSYLVTQILQSDNDLGAVCLISLLGKVAYASEPSKTDAIRNAANQAHYYTSEFDNAIERLIMQAVNHKWNGGDEE
jgi:hypothetical protein